MSIPRMASADDPAAGGIMEKVAARNNGDNQEFDMETIQMISAPGARRAKPKRPAA